MGISRGYGSMRYKRYFAALRKLQDYGFIEFKEIFPKNGSKLIDKVTIVDDDRIAEVLDYYNGLSPFGNCITKDYLVSRYRRM